MDTKKMIQNRELNMDDYLAMFRRRARSILIPALIGPLLGYLAFLPVKKFYGKYTSQSVVLIEARKYPRTWSNRWFPMTSTRELECFAPWPPATRRCAQFCRTYSREEQPGH